MPNPRIVFHWSAYEHDHIERGADWFWALAIISVCIAIVSILFHDVLFAVLVIVAAITIAILAVHPPNLVEFEIGERGIRVAGTLHRFEEIISFWVEDETEDTHAILLVDTIKFMSPNIVISLEHVDPHEVRAYLSERTDEVPMKEPVSHKILEFFGL